MGLVCTECNVGGCGRSIIEVVRCVYNSLPGFGLQFLLLLDVVSSSIVYGVVFVAPHVMWRLPCALLLVCCLGLLGSLLLHPRIYLQHSGDEQT
jgi:hypothetical protein